MALPPRSSPHHLRRLSITLGLVAVLVLAGCGGVLELEPEPSLPISTAPQAVDPVEPAIPLTPSADLIQIEQRSPVDDALAVTMELFASAHVVVLAPHDDTAAVWLAASIAAEGGVPLLLSGKFDGRLNSELIRLEAHGVVTVGAVDLGEIDTTSLSIVPFKEISDGPSGPSGDLASHDWVAYTPAGSAVAQLNARPAGRLFGPPPESVLSSEIEPVGQLQPLSATKRVENVVMLAAHGASVAALANAKAAGAQLLEFDSEIAGDPQLIAALNAASPESILTLGVAIDADLPWLLASAINGELLPSGTQRPFTPTTRYVGVSGQAGEVAQPTPLLAEMAQLQGSAHALDTDPVAPLAVIGAAEGSAAERNRFIEAIAQRGGLTLLDVSGPDIDAVLATIDEARGMLRHPHVGILVDATLLHGDGTDGPYTGISALDLAEITHAIDAIVRNRAIPAKLVAVGMYNADFWHGQLPEEEVTTPLLWLMNGLGEREEKELAWASMLELLAPDAHLGWVVYPDQEADYLTPDDALRLDPRLDVVIYQ